VTEIEKVEAAPIFGLFPPSYPTLPVLCHLDTCIRQVYTTINEILLKITIIGPSVSGGCGIRGRFVIRRNCGIPFWPLELD
jgi:hypothetical protein